MTEDRPEPEDAPPAPQPADPDDSIFDGETILKHEGADRASDLGNLDATVAGAGSPASSDTAIPRTRAPEGGATSVPPGARAVLVGALSGERYEDLGEIARGGMGAILRVADSDLRRQVAMKVILDRGDPARTDRFLEEAQVTGQLEHPNIVPIHELGRGEDGRAYFTMKLVKGESLQHIIDRLAAGDEEFKEEYPLSRLLNILLKVCNALAFAHSRGVVHRDLKPENVMVGSFGEVLVMDWGLAKILGRDGEPEEEQVATLRTDKDGGRTLEGSVMGTPSYMPPEQADGRHRDVDQRSDVFALGALLYALLTHTPPYLGSSVYNIVDQALKAEVEPPRQRATGQAIPGELASICMKAMDRDPGARYPSVTAMEEDIQAFLDRRLVSAHAYGPGARLVRFVQRNPTPSIAAAVAAFLLVVGGSALGVVLSQKRAAELEAQAQEARRREAEATADAEESRRKAAETQAALDRAEKKAAVRRADEAEASLKKSLKVAGFLRHAYVEVGGLPGALKTVLLSSKSRKEKTAELSTLLERVDRYEETLPHDAAVQATWQALKGWMYWNARKRKESEALFRQARETDPDVVYGWLFEALAIFARYVQSEHFTNYYVTDEDGVVWTGKPGENTAQKKARERFESLIEELGSGKTWGQNTAQEFLQGVEGFRAYYRGDVKAAIPGIGRALMVPDMVWIADELYFARAKARMLLFDFPGTLADLDRAHGFGTMGSRPLHYKAQALQVKGYMEQHAGRDPLPPWREAIRIFDEEERLFPRAQVYDQMRGMIHQSIARIVMKRGGDPTPHFSKALRDFTAGLNPPGTHAVEFNRAVSYWSRSELRLYMAEHDEKTGRDPGPNLKKAVDDSLEGLAGYMNVRFGYSGFMRALGRYCRHLSSRGTSPSAFLGGWLDRTAKELSSPETGLRAAMERLLLLGFVGRMDEALQLSERTKGLPRPWRLYREWARKIREGLPEARWRRLFLQARFWSDVGDLGTARGLNEEALVEAGEKTPGNDEERKDRMALHYNTACLQAQASAGRTSLKETPDPVDEAAAERLKKSAIQNLRRAVALGWTDRRKMAEDPDLAPLRDLPAFRKIVKG